MSSMMLNITNSIPYQPRHMNALDNNISLDMIQIENETIFYTQFRA